MNSSHKPHWEIGPLDGEFVGAIVDGETIQAAEGARNDDNLFDGAIPLFRIADDGAEIVDHERGLIYEARIGQKDGRQWLTSLTIRTVADDQRIDQGLMRSVPVQRIAEQVALHLAVQREEGMAWKSDEPHASRHDLPTVEQVAEDYVAGLGRSAIAAKYQMSVYTVDVRIRAGRDRGIIRPAKVGRKRARQEKEGNQ